MESKALFLFLCTGMMWNTPYLQAGLLDAPSGSGSWLWEDGHTELDGISFQYYLQHTDVYDELVLCVFQCLQIRECQSFTVQFAGSGYLCRFHSRRFSYAESGYLGSPMMGLIYYMLHSDCPTSDSHFFSREARMCVSIYAVKRKRSDARDYCVGLGGDLVVIDTDAKEAFIADVLTQTGSWSTVCFHTDAQAISGVYRWPDGSDVSTNLMPNPTYDPQAKCLEVIYDSPGQLLAQTYDCSSKSIRVICEYPI